MENQNEQKSKILIEGIRIISIQDYFQQMKLEQIDQRTLEKHGKLIGKFVYEFNIIESNFKWEIRKTIKDFILLEKELAKHYKDYQKQFGVQENKENKNNWYLEYLSKFLQTIIEKHIYNNNNKDLQKQLEIFIEKSDIKYSPEEIKYKEQYIYKRAGGRELSCAKMLLSCQQLFGCWSTRYMSISNEGVFYHLSHKSGPSDSKKDNTRESILFDTNFSMLYGKMAARHDQQILIISSKRKLCIKSQSLFQFYDLLFSLKKAQVNSVYSAVQRYHSFAPIRPHTNCRFYIDGEFFFQDLMECLQTAKEEVYITGWWLSPQLYLVRPVDPLQPQHLRFRLDHILQALLLRQVKVYILLFNEPRTALYQDSTYVVNLLQSLEGSRQYLHILRHPNNLLPSQLWSHHEKLVVVDQQVGFLGGLDLCFGRWDTQAHSVVQLKQEDKVYWPGKDYHNTYLKDFTDIQQYEKSLIDENTQPRMPFHDSAVMLKGGAVKDLTRHFVQYWNHVQSEGNKKGHLLKPTSAISHPTLASMSNQVQLKFQSFKNKYIHKINDTLSQHSSLSSHHQYHKLNESDDESQIISNDNNSNNKNHKRSKSIDQLKKMMPGGRSFDDLTKIIKLNAQKLKQTLKGQEQNDRFINIKQQKQSGEEKQREEKKRMKMECCCQVVRSVSKWSIGLRWEGQEESVHQAYQQLIQESKHFIYIENQFFCSSTAGPMVNNQVAQALVNRIQQAILNDQVYHVFVVLPLMPGFEGQLGNGDEAFLKTFLFYKYQTIFRSPTSIYQQLSKCLQQHTGDASNMYQRVREYITFYGLRNYGQLPKGDYTTEIVYVHSKLMLVDDQTVLLGSANINDRSLLGNRDSELALVIQDQQTISTLMHHQPYQAAHYAYTL